MRVCWTFEPGSKEEAPSLSSLFNKTISTIELLAQVWNTSSIPYWGVYSTAHKKNTRGRQVADKKETEKKNGTLIRLASVEIRLASEKIRLASEKIRYRANYAIHMKRGSRVESREGSKG